MRQLLENKNKLGARCAGLEIEGVMNVPSGVQIAQLALKHRQNKNQRQRIVLFAGSPINADKETLVKIGKKLKKNNVAVDIVNFGEEDPSKVRRQHNPNFTSTSKSLVLDPAHRSMLWAFKSSYSLGPFVILMSFRSPLSETWLSTLYEGNCKIRLQGSSCSHLKAVSLDTKLVN
jgi:hypothetical protein